MNFNQKNSTAIVQGSNLVDDAFIDLSQSNPPDLIRRVTLKLDQGKSIGSAQQFSFAYKALYIQEATDSNTNVQWRPFTSQNNDFVTLRKNDVLNFEKAIRGGLFTWDAQPAKEVTLVFILNGNFEAGSTYTEVENSSEGSNLKMSNVGITNVGSEIVATDNDRGRILLSCTGMFEIASSALGPYIPVPDNKIDIASGASIFARSVGLSETVSILEVTNA